MPLLKMKVHGSNRPRSHILPPVTRTNPCSLELSYASALSTLQVEPTFFST